MVIEFVALRKQIPTGGMESKKQPDLFHKTLQKVQELAALNISEMRVNIRPKLASLLENMLRIS